MRAIEGAIYCKACVGMLSGRTPVYLAVRYPASHEEGKGTCWRCGKTIEFQAASKVVRREEAKE